MDRDETKALERVYNNLVTQHKCRDKKIDQKILHNNISKLKDMGLEFKQSSNRLYLKSKIESINKQALAKQLKLTGIDKPLNYFFTTQSTNIFAKQHKTEAIYVAEHQSLGTGRRLKKWLSPLGQCIALSINHQFNFGLKYISGFNIAIGVAIINTAKQFGCNELGLKWPNDVFSKNGKVAGILIEVSGNSQNTFVTVGVGVNWSLSSKHFNLIDQQCDNISIDGCTKADFIAQLIIEIEACILEFDKNRLTNLLQTWHDNDMFINQLIKVSTTQKTYQAIYLGVNTSGLLTVQTDTEIKTLSSSEVKIQKI